MAMVTRVDEWDSGQVQSVYMWGMWVWEGGAFVSYTTEFLL